MINMEQKFIKSPMNYIGGKYKILPQLTQLFPNHINKFIDLFAGGLNVAINVSAEEKYCNDINSFVIDIYKAFQQMPINSLLNYIDKTIVENNLSMQNQAAYLAFREKYNKNKQPLDLYILLCYSFNYQLRFNSKHDFNNSFGKNRSSFNPTMRENLKKFHQQIKHINFQTLDFYDYNIENLGKKDFLYADPPYLITCGSYNDGKRGFKGWNEKDDIALFKLLDYVNERGIKFALSNVSEHKGLKNKALISWMEKYNVYDVNHNYNNSNYQAKNREHMTREILITNY